MDGNRRKHFKKQQTTHFKRKGPDRKGKWKKPSREEPSRNSLPADTVYRILCPSRKIGGVIGKGGGIIKGLREDTRAKITVPDSFPGSDERVIIISSCPGKISRNQITDKGNDKGSMEPHCAAQDALLKVHDRIVAEDFSGGVAPDDNENNVITARLLVPNNMVGCLLGKKGDVIQRLRSETGASIRVLPADHLPPCAMSTDELVQISAKPDVAKRALYEISTLLHQNPRKDQSPSVSMPYGGPSFQTPGPGGPMANMLPPGNQMFRNRNSASHIAPPIPLMKEYNRQAPGFGPGGFANGPPGHGGEHSAEFSMKILCSSGKIGGVIGKGGSNVKLIQQETGASIHVEEAPAESDERVIRVSSFEVLWNPRSQAIDAILLLQNKTSEVSEKGTVTTRLLVPSSKVGCILGQGGQVINEMRRRTQADIRVFSKDEKPKCASEDEELVQISGNFAVAKDALAEIASRLRVRTLRDSNSAIEPGHLGPVQGFGPARILPARIPELPGMIGPGSSGGFEAPRGELGSFQRSGSVGEMVEGTSYAGGGLDYEPRSYPDPSAMRYPNPSSAFDPNLNNGVHSRPGAGGISSVGEVPVPRVQLQDTAYGPSDNLIEYHGSSDGLRSAQNFLPPFPSGPYQNMNPYPNTSGQQNPSMSQAVSLQQSPFALTAQSGVYRNASAPLTAYTQPGSYNH